MKNNNFNNSQCNQSGNAPINIAHFNAKTLIYLWFFSFLFLLTLGILGYIHLDHEIIAQCVKGA